MGSLENKETNANNHVVELLSLWIQSKRSLRAKAQ